MDAITARVKQLSGNLPSAGRVHLMKMVRQNERLRKKVEKLWAPPGQKPKKKRIEFRNEEERIAHQKAYRHAVAIKKRKHGGRLVGQFWMANPLSWGPCPCCNYPLPHLTDRQMHLHRLMLYRKKFRNKAIRRAAEVREQKRQEAFEAQMKKEREERGE